MPHKHTLSHGSERYNTCEVHTLVAEMDGEKHFYVQQANTKACISSGRKRGQFCISFQRKWSLFRDKLKRMNRFICSHAFAYRAIAPHAEPDYSRFSMLICYQIESHLSPQTALKQETNKVNRSPCHLLPTWKGSFGELSALTSLSCRALCAMKTVGVSFPLCGIDQMPEAENPLDLAAQCLAIASRFQAANTFLDCFEKNDKTN